MAIRFKHLHHVTISVPENSQQQVIEFYEKSLGLKRVEHPKEFENTYQVWWYQLTPEARLHINFDPPFVKTTANRHFAVEVEDIKEARKVCENNHVKIIEDIRIPNYERFHIEDPFGNDIELLMPAKQPARS